ncbi:MAG: proprotein convertase P-domain-containing protein [Emcibacteraceae bacterium]|nr:proprotein convertase P-domain-containing protein [Emcibacteraceae bacterium]
MLDVHGAVRLAETWQFQHTSGNLVTHDVAFGTGETIEFGTAVEFDLDMSGLSDLDLDVMSLSLGISHDYWPELQITVISPEGTESIILDTGGLTANSISEFNVSMTGAMDWEVLSRAFWNENTSGTWTIRIEDMVDNGNSGTVDGITAHFEGDVNTGADTYFFTDEWAMMNEYNGGIATLNDNVGVNTINASPVSDDIILDLSAGATSQIGGVDAFSLSGSTTIDIGITGDGDDIIRGLDTGDSVYAMRGDDTIEITATDFALINGHNGEDTLMLDGSGINLDLSTDTIINMEVIDLTGSGNNSLTLTLQDLLDATDSDNQLIIDGNAGDSVTSSNEGWSQGADQNIDGVTYHTYTAGTGTLLIDEDVTQTIA